MVAEIERGGVQVMSLVGDLAESALPAYMVRDTIARFGTIDSLANNAADQHQSRVAGLRELANHAQGFGLALLAENIDYPPVRPLMGRGRQTRDICEEVDSPAFRLIYDAGCSLAVGGGSIRDA